MSWTIESVRKAEVEPAGVLALGEFDRVGNTITQVSLPERVWHGLGRMLRGGREDKAC